MALEISKKSAAVRLLRRKFEKGFVTPDMKPSYMREIDPVFMTHKPNNFRTCFNNIGKECFTQNLVNLLFSLLFLVICELIETFLHSFLCVNN